MLSTLRKRRLERGLRVKELAEIIGYSPALVSGVELLQVRPSQQFRDKTSDALGLPASALFPEWDVFIERARGSVFDDAPEAASVL